MINIEIVTFGEIHLYAMILKDNWRDCWVTYSSTFGGKKEVKNDEILPFSDNFAYA